MTPDLNNVRVFHEVVARGSFTRAAQALGLPPSAVSRRVASLEDELGFQLLHRTTRRVGLTDDGRIFHERTMNIVRDVLEAQAAVERTRQSPTGRVRVTAPPDDGGVIWSMLSGFVMLQPGVDLELIHTLTYLDLIEENIDLALRGGAPPASDRYRAHLLIDTRLVLVASPTYLDERGAPQTARDLEHHDCIAMDTWAPNAIPALRDGGDGGRVRLRNRVRVNRQETARLAAVDGAGIAPMVMSTCQRELDAGDLVEVLPGIFPGPAQFWAVVPADRPPSSASRALLEHLLGWSEANAR